MGVAWKVKRWPTRGSKSFFISHSAIRGALVSFVETPGQTLIIKLTPLAKVPALQLVQTLKTDPLIALTQFRIEASTGL